MVTATPCAMASRTMVKPGSDIPGVPPSLITATSLPSLSRPMMRFPARSSLCSWNASNGFLMP
jgi:hypothetical protein